MKIYVAARLANFKAVRAVQENLRILGHEITFDWTQYTQKEDVETQDLVDGAINDLHGIEKADALVALLPAKSGTHVEIGMALALKKIIILVTPPEHESEFTVARDACCFYWSPNVVRIIEKYESAAFRAHEILNTVFPSPRSKYESWR